MTLTFLLAVAPPAWGKQVLKIARADAPAGAVALPLILPDDFGIQWDVQPDGSIGDGGRDLYDGGGHLSIDGGTQFNAGGMAHFDPALNELTLGPIDVKGLKVSRRIAVHKKHGFCRWAEVIENPTGQKVSLSLRIQYDMGGSINVVQPLADEKGAKQQIGVAFGDERHNYGVLGAGRGARVLPRFNPQLQTDNFAIEYAVEVPARQTAVIVHAHVYRQQLPAAMQALREIKDKEYLGQLPRELQRKVINFRRSDLSIGEGLEVLRGDANLDVVELRSGDLLRGTLREPSYRLTSFYGDVELPAGKVIGLLNVGTFRPRQLAVTADGEIFGGRLTKETIALQFSSGQTMQLPLSHVARVGYRKRSGEPEEWTFDKPMLHLRTGDRIAVRPPAADVEVSTRYGRLALRPQAIAALIFASEEDAAHRVVLADGSSFAAVVTSESLALELAGAAADAAEGAGAAGGKAVSFPVGSIARLQLVADLDALGGEEAAPSMALANGDRLTAAIEGTLRLETAFDTIAVNAGEVRALSHVAGGSPSDVRVVLWDDSLVQGNLREATLACRTVSGVALSVPVALVTEYEQPRPTPSEAVAKTITDLVAELGVDDWKRRDAAQERLLNMGPVAIGTLKRLREGLSPEAQQRIDLILPRLEEAGRREAGGTSGAQ